MSYVECVEDFGNRNCRIKESIGPGTLRRQTPISASACNLAGPLRRGTSPSLSTSGQMFNASELGTLPRSGTLPRGVSPGPAAVNFSYHF